MLSHVKLITDNMEEIKEIRRGDRSKRNLEEILKNFIDQFGKNAMKYEISEVKVGNYRTQVRVFLEYINEPKLIIMASENVGTNGRKRCYDEIIRYTGYLGINTIYTDILNAHSSKILNNNGVNYSNYPEVKF